MGLIPPTPPESATPKPKPKPTLHLSRKPANATNDTSTTLDTPLPTYIPTPIPSLQNTKITTLATSPTAQHILALSTITNTLYALGAGEQNQLGRRLTERNKLHGLDASKVEFPKSKSKSKEKGKGRVEITAICTADESSYALDSQGRIWTWGARFGAVSEGKDTALPQLHPAFVDLEVDGDVGPMVEIAASREVLFARTGGGCVVSAGRLDGLGSGHDISALPREDVAAVGGWRIGGMGSGVPASEGPAVLLKAQKIVFPRSEDAEEDDVHIISISASSCSASAVSKGGHCFVWGSGSGWRNGLGLSGRGGHRLGPGVLASEKLNSLEACADVEVPRDVWMGGLNVDVVRQVVLGGGSGGAAGGFGVYCAIADPGAQLVREQQGGECRREKKKALAGKEVGRDAGKFDMDDLGAAQKRRSLVAGVAGGEMLG